MCGEGPERTREASGRESGIRKRELGAEEGAGAHGEIASDEDAERNGGWLQAGVVVRDS